MNKTKKASEKETPAFDAESSGGPEPTDDSESSGASSESSSESSEKEGKKP